jgi:single-strand DNA-binding protein
MKTIKNHVQVMGRLGADPQVKILDNGTKVARFSVAVNDNYTNKKGEKVSSVQWHQVVAWGNLATIAERLLHKGTQVTVDGRLSVRSYTAKDGTKRTVTEIMANEMFAFQQQAA